MSERRINSWQFMGISIVLAALFFMPALAYRTHRAKVELEQARQEIDELKWAASEGVTWKWSEEVEPRVGRRIRIPIRHK